MAALSSESLTAILDSEKHPSCALVYSMGQRGALDQSRSEKVISRRRVAASAALCGIAVLAAAGLLGFDSPRIETVASPRADVPPPATFGMHPTAFREHRVSAVEVATLAVARDPDPVRWLEAPSTRIAFASTADPTPGDLNEVARAVAVPDAQEAPSAAPAADDCLATQECIDRYLWSLYERAPKVDTIKVPERIKVTVKKKGKTRTITKVVIKLVDEDFTWKDPKAAQKAGMPMIDYVIGGMDRSFKLRLYHALRALDEAGLAPGITSGFRDDYRQSLASGNHAASDSSYHGGSRRGGYSHGVAADIVSVKGETRGQRWISSENLWKWIDDRGKEFGIGRPYLDRDAPHVGPIDGKEYVEKRRAHAERVAAKAKAPHKPAAREDHGKTPRAKTAASKVRSI
jgi:hypothetical protein